MKIENKYFYHDIEKKFDIYFYLSFNFLSFLILFLLFGLIFILDCGSIIFLGCGEITNFYILLITLLIFNSIMYFNLIKPFISENLMLSLDSNHEIYNNEIITHKRSK